MTGLLGDLRNVYGSRQSSPATRRLRTREKIVAGIKLDVPDETHSSKAGHGEGEGSWIFSFCDLIMNLLMFFIMMFAISTVDQDKLAVIQHALVSYTKKGNVKEAPRAEGTGAATPSAGLAGAGSPEDAMKRIKELLASIDVSRLKSAPTLAKDFGALKSRIVDLETLVGAQVMPDQDETSFQIVIADERMFDTFSNGQVTDGGRLVLARLVSELGRFRNPLRIAVLSGEREGAALPAGDVDAWAATARKAALVAAGLRKAGLRKGHVLSAGGLGAVRDTESVPQWPGHVVVHVALLRQKPYVHRGKDSVK